ncbi:MAG: transcription initiation factor IIB family protein [Candidatus Bathyarchaeia archaeon]
MSAVAALIRYNPCSVHARRGSVCPFSYRGIGQRCPYPHGLCDSLDYDGWFKDVLAGKIKCFYPNRIRLFESAGGILVLYHTHKRAIVGEAKVIRVTSEKKMYYYWFDKFLLYPNPVSVRLLRTDPILKKLARGGTWTIIYLSKETLKEIRELSELWGKSSERLQRELELAKEQGNRSTLPRDDVFFVNIGMEKLNDMGVKPEILEKTREIFREAVKRKLLRGRSSELIFYASLFLAFRALGIPKRSDEIQRIGNIELKKLISSVNLLRKNIELKIPFLSSKEWISYYSRKLEVPDKIVQLALSLSENMKTEGPIKHRSPISVAATALYVAYLTAGEKIMQEKIASTFGITSVTLRNLTKLWFSYKNKQISHIAVVS